MGGKKKIQSLKQLIPHNEWRILIVTVHGAEVRLLLVGFHQKKCKITEVNLMHMFDQELAPGRPYNEAWGTAARSWWYMTGRLPVCLPHTSVLHLFVLQELL